MLNGFRALHEKNIIHRDIKLDNFMLDNKNVLKIIDFGFSKRLKDIKDKT